MVTARGRVELAEKRRCRKETAVICTYMSRLAGNKFATFDSIYKKMEVKDPDDESQVRRYSGSYPRQIEKHIAWLKTPEARELQNASNH